MAYRVKQEFAHIVELTTAANGKRVGLNGGYTKKVPASIDRPEQTIQVPAATPSDLEWLFKAGNPCIEEVEAAKEQAITVKANG